MFFTLLVSIREKNALGIFSWNRLEQKAESLQDAKNKLRESLIVEYEVHSIVSVEEYIAHLTANAIVGY